MNQAEVGLRDFCTLSEAERGLASPLAIGHRASAWDETSHESSRLPDQCGGGTRPDDEDSDSSPSQPDIGHSDGDDAITAEQTDDPICPPAVNPDDCPHLASVQSLTPGEGSDSPYRTPAPEGDIELSLLMATRIDIESRSSAILS